MGGDEAELSRLKAEALGNTSSSHILSAGPFEETFNSDPDAGRSEHRGHLSIKAAHLLDRSQQPPRR